MNDPATIQTKASFDSLATVYDPLDELLEWAAFRRWREKFWAQVRGERVLEVGVGTGKNLPYYPGDADNGRGPEREDAGAGATARPRAGPGR